MSDQTPNPASEPVVTPFLPQTAPIQADEPSTPAGTALAEQGEPKKQKAKRNMDHLVQYQYKKGQTGNPNGRRRPITDRLVAGVERRLPHAYRVKLEEIWGHSISDRCTWADMIAMATLRQAMTDVAARKDLMDRLEGPVKQKMELTGADGAPLTTPSLVIVFSDDEKVIDMPAIPVPLDPAPSIEGAGTTVGMVLDKLDELLDKPGPQLVVAKKKERPSWIRAAVEGRQDDSDR